MHLTRITTGKKAGFRRAKLHRHTERPKQASTYLKQKSSFFMAALSLAAFVAGNMAGEHGWYAFWKAVLGNADDALVVYTGVVTPIESVPNYKEWSLYGGDSEQHTFKQVPKDMLIPLPMYNQSDAKKGLDPSGVYSVGDRGSYDSGAEGAGSHPGVDIRVPVGTPVRAIAAGIVTQVQNDVGGYGYFIVIRHPHMPDPNQPTRETVLHSAYAHLSSQLVREGDIVEKGQLIALSGQTGFATGPHLHFQVDRDEAPWHPYWPFTSSEARNAGMTTTQAINAGLHQERLKDYTTHPMLLVQANHPAPIYKHDGSSTIAVKKSRLRTRDQILSVREQRKNDRLARLARETPAPAMVARQTLAPMVVEPDAIEPKTLAVEAPYAAAPFMPSANPVASFDIQTPPRFTPREWVTVRITLLDEHGRATSEEMLEKNIYLRTAYGDAEFQPSVLRKDDFDNGTATVKMLPRGGRTVIILLQPFAFQSAPIAPAK